MFLTAKNYEDIKKDIQFLKDAVDLQGCSYLDYNYLRYSVRSGKIKEVEDKLDRLMKYLGIEEIDTEAVPSEKKIVKITKEK